MSHFYGGIKGGRGPATRCGFKNSGYHAYAQGWQGGVQVYLFHNDEKDEDRFVIFLDGGGGYGNRIQLATGVLDIGKIIKGEAPVQINEDIWHVWAEHRARQIMTEGVEHAEGDDAEHVAAGEEAGRPEAEMGERGG